MKKIIRVSKHTLKYANQNKLNTLSNFIDEYRRVAQLYLNHIWNNRITHVTKNKTYTLDVSRNRINFPKYLDYKIINPNTTLSARALSSCMNQVLGMLKSATKKQSKRLWKVRDLLSESQQPSKSLINKIRQQKPIKPNASNLIPELSSKCADFQETTGNFNACLRLSSIGKTFGQIKLPIKYHHKSNCWKSTGKMLGSFLIDKSYINIRWEIPRKTKSSGNIVGADQGLNDVLTLSNEQVTPKTDNHGYTLHKILDKLSRKKKGSMAFSKAQDHRKNFINWSINQLNLKNIKQINLEEIWNIRYKSKSSRKMSHWTNTLIRDKLLRSCEEQEVLVKLQPSAYRSQRCSSCGLVRKANRKGKQYTCKGCSFSLDSDLNAAKNHEQDLYYLNWELRKFIKTNRANLGSGFYWKTEGLFKLTGEEIRVPLSTNEDSNI